MIVKNDNDLVRVHIQISPQGDAEVQIVPTQGHLEEHAVAVITPLERQQIEQVRNEHMQNVLHKINCVTMRILQSQENPEALAQVIEQSNSSSERLTGSRQLYFEAFFPTCLGIIQGSFEDTLFSWIIPRKDREEISQAGGVAELKWLLSPEDLKAIVRAQCVPEARQAADKISHISPHFSSQLAQEIEDARATYGLMVDLCKGLGSFTRADLRTLKAALQRNALIPVPLDAAYFSSEENRILAQAMEGTLDSLFQKHANIGQAFLERMEEIIDERLTKRARRVEVKASEIDEKQPDLKREKK